MLTDLRHSLRLLIRQPGFTAAACLTLALGIGANAAMFSVVDAALLRPLPYRAPDRLVAVVSKISDDVYGLTSTPARVRVLHANAGVFEGLSGYSISTNVAPAGSPLADAQWIGQLPPGFMEFLGVSPQIGRAFTNDDVQGDDAAIVSDTYWTRQLHRDPNVIGEHITIKGRARTIIGVAPASFRYLVSNTPPTEAWLPERIDVASRVVGRLRPGLTMAAAERELGAALARDAGFGPEPWESRETGHTPTVVLEPVDIARASGLSKTAIWSMLAAVGIVLAIACANVANLLLGRTVMRRREVATRMAMGATRWQIARLFLCEGMALAGLGGWLASVVAAWALSIFPSIVPNALMTYSFFSVFTPSVDARVGAFAVAAALVTGLVCGVVPALRAITGDSTAGVLAGTRVVGASRGQRRVRDAFQAAQVAMAFVLVAAASVMITSVAKMVRLPPGFAIDGLESGLVQMPSKVDRDAAYDAILARVRGMSTIEAATIGTPPAKSNSGTFFGEGEPIGRDRNNLAVHYVRPEYFSLVGLPIRVGRPIAADDVPGAPLVALVDEDSARRHFPDGALGKRLRTQPNGPWITVVGIVGRVKTTKLDVTNAGEAYVSLAQWPDVREELVIRTRGAGPSLADLRGVVQSVDSRINVVTLTPGSESYSAVLAAPTFYLTLLTVFAALGLVTAVVGLSGLLAHAVVRRTAEIGVRMALGADAAQTRRLVVSEALVPVAVGLAIGLGLAPVASRALTYDLFQVTPGSPLALGAGAVIFLMVSALAAYSPVRRATRIDPVIALRAE